MISKRYEEIITEHFNIRDDNTRHTLLNIDEADQNRVLESLTSQLYKNIMDKVADIDFGGITNTKGDITQLENYDQLLECIEVMRKILVEYRQDLTPITTITTAIENVKSRTEMWKKAYLMKADMPVMIYNTITLSIVSSVSLLIATSIEFIKDAGSESYTIALDKVAYVRNRDGMLFSNLKRWNNICANGELDKSLDHVFKNMSKSFGGDPLSVLGFVAIAGIIINIIPLMRELVFFFYNTKQSVSDYFLIQADLLQMNAEYVKNNPNMDSSEKKKVVASQQKIAKTFRSISNTLTIKNKSAEVKVKKDIDASKKKYNIDDVVDTKLDSLDSTPSSIF